MDSKTAGSVEAELQGRSEFFKVGAGEFVADMRAMRSLQVMVTDGVDMDALVKLIEDGEYESVAGMLRERFGTDETEAVRDMRDGMRLAIYFKTLDRAYRIVPEPGGGEDAYYQPMAGAARSLREEARQTIAKAVAGADAAEEGKTTYENLYRIAIMRSVIVALNEHLWAPKAEEKGDPAPASAEEGAEESAGEAKAEPAPAPVERTVVRERVVVKEEPPVIESMLRDFMMKAMAQVAVDDMVPRIKEKIIAEFGIEPVVHTVKLVDREEKKVEGVVHERFDEMLHCIANDIPVYAFGPAGSGKNVLVKQCADALGLDFHFMNSVTDEYKIAGFVDANGLYHETEFYRAFKDGGVFFLDEMDASAPEVLVCLNAAIANRYFAFPTGTVEAHEDFRVVAAGNTLGTGADASYTGRMQLDAASLNRFAIIPVDYDPAIDMLSAGGDAELCGFIGQYRAAVRKCGLPNVASYRNIAQIKALEQAMPLERAICYALTKEMNKDDINTVVGSGDFDRGNRYFKALQGVESLVG